MAHYTVNSRRARKGFTIVELLIVIVVIAILAAISVVAYTGIQQRANNAKTLGAVNAYVKALNLYKADQGQYPPATSCMGTEYQSGCHSGGSYIVNGGNLNTTYLSSYFGSSAPMPAANLGESSAGTMFGGAIYVWNSVTYGGTQNGGVGLYHQGGGDCPPVGGLTYVSSQDYTDGTGKRCRYSMLHRANRDDTVVRQRFLVLGKAAPQGLTAPSDAGKQEVRGKALYSRGYGALHLPHRLRQ